MYSQKHVTLRLEKAVAVKHARINHENIFMVLYELSVQKYNVIFDKN